jgi:5-hydroxyisourate hydrolase
MSNVTTHVLDTARGKPATGVAIVLSRNDGGAWSEIGRGATDDDGRLRTLLGGRPLVRGVYRLDFATRDYFAGLGLACFFPEVSITFEIVDETSHHHVPLLLSPYGYSTYRGS